ncbi:MAG: DUF6790 family protein [Gemmatimonadales bacterium]
MRPLTPPLELLRRTSGWRRWPRTAAFGSFYFFVRWLVGGIPFFALVAALGVWDWRVGSKVAGRRTLEEVLVQHYVFFTCGVGGIWNTIGHSVMADSVARSIGWAPGSGFQLELAAAHFGLALVAFAVPWTHWHATASIAVAKCVFLLGAGAVHLHDALTSGNHAVNNTGFATLWFGDILVPLTVLVLIVRASRRPGTSTPE